MGDIPTERKKELQERMNQAISDVFAYAPEVEAEKRRIDLIREALNRFVNEQFEIAAILNMR